MTDPTPTQICDAYRAQLRRLYGNEIADKSEIHYSRGWYYIKLARRAPDGSVGVWWEKADAKRKAQILEMTVNLVEREPPQ